MKRKSPNQKAKRNLDKTIERQIGIGIPIGQIISSLEKRKRQILAQAEKILKKLKISSPKFDQILIAHNAQIDWAQYIDKQISNLRDLMLKRNGKARRLEQVGRIKQAISIYESNVKDQFNGSLPYDRLRIIYTRQKQYPDAIRVCQAYLALSKRATGQNKPRFRQHLQKLRQRAKKRDHK